MTEDQVVDPFDPEDVARAAKQTESAHSAEENAATQALLARREAYVRVFAGSGTADDTRTVLDDLRKFCRGDQSAFDPDARVHALLSGRQEVWMRIQDHTRLDMHALVTKYTSKPEQWRG